MSTPLGVRGWQPDENLVEHVRMCGMPITELTGPDRAWVVAGLAAAGWTAEETAAHLRCSLRLIRQIRSEPMCVVATYALELREQLIIARMAETEAKRKATQVAAGLRAELRYVKTQRNRLIEKKSANRRIPA